jgi:hypothetical protein
MVQEPVFGPLVVFGLGTRHRRARDRAARLIQLTAAYAARVFHGQEKTHQD